MTKLSTTGFKTTAHNSDARIKFISDKELALYLDEVIEFSKELPHRYFITLSTPNFIIRKRKKVIPDLNGLIGKTFTNIAKKRRTHIKVWGSVNYWEHNNSHLIVLSERPLTEELIRQEWGWRCAFRESSLAQKIRPIEPDRIQNAVGYTLQKHHKQHTFKMFHPRTNRCRRGTCSVCNLDLKTKVTEKLMN